MTKQEMLQLKMTATRVRMGIIEATHGGKSGHPGGSLSAADVLTYLYFKEMQIDPQNPQDPDRDRFVLSKGHAAPGLYSVLAERGFFPVADLPTLRRSGSYLQGHPNMNTVPGVDMSTGSLEQAFILFDRSHGSGKPTCFLLHTTKGLGVSFMENAVDWHGKAPNDAEYDKAMAELRASYEVMEKEAERING